MTHAPRAHRPNSLRRATLTAALVLGGIAIVTMFYFVTLARSSRARADAATRQLIDEQLAADRIVSAAYAQQLAAYRYLRVPNPAVLAEFRAHGEEAYAGVRQYLFREMPLSARLKVETIKEAHQQFEVTSQHAFDIAIGGDAARARLMLEALGEDASRLDVAVREFIQERVQQRDRLHASQDQAARRIQVATIILAVVLAGVGLVLAEVFRRRVMRPLDDLTDAVERFAESDGLDVIRVAPQRYAEFQRLADDFEQMAGRIRAAGEHRRRLEQQFQHSQKMEAVGTLAGGIAHDFNNMLTVIRLHSQFLEAQLPPEGEARENLAAITLAAVRGTALTQQILAFSRKQMLQPTVLDVRRVVGALEPMLRRLIDETVTVVTSCEEDVGFVKADRGQLEQVIVNLAVNARDAMPSGGRLGIDVREIELSLEHELVQQQHCTPGPYIVVAVSDTGTGMDQEVMARIFEPFFTTKPVGKGSGLGLSTAYGIVKQSGGHLAVQSTLGSGTTFSVYLPIVAAAATEESAPTPARQPPPEAGAAEPGRTILLVEDEFAVRELARRTLERAGYEVLAARNGVEALRLHSEAGAPIDLLVTDATMPKMGGRQLADALRERQPDIPVVFISGYTAMDVAPDELSAMGMLFLAKPFEVSDLLSAVSAALAAPAPTV